jgi:hypothetical protein
MAKKNVQNVVKRMVKRGENRVINAMIVSIDFQINQE